MARQLLAGAWAGVWWAAGTRQVWHVACSRAYTTSHLTIPMHVCCQLSHVWRTIMLDTAAGVCEHVLYGG